MREEVDFSRGAIYSWGLISGLEDQRVEEFWVEVELRVVGLDCFSATDGVMSIEWRMGQD